MPARTFLLFGVVVLGPALGELDWRVALYAVASLTVVRMLPVALAHVRIVDGRTDTHELRLTTGGGS